MPRPLKLTGSGCGVFGASGLSSAAAGFGFLPVMAAPPSEPLETLKYSELQRLAKAWGLKANLKADKLLNVLKQHTDEMKQETRCVIVTELSEKEGSQNAGSQKTKEKNQNECLANSTMAGNVAENLATPSNQREKNCMAPRTVESKTPVDYFSGMEHCYSNSLSRSRRKKINSATPNFKKLHEAQFKKMQSIDDYMKNKNKRIHNISNSMNKAKTCSSGLLSPNPQKRKLSATCTPINLRRTPRDSRIMDKNTLSHKSAFVSTGFSATKMNVRFSESTKDNEHKRSLTKTPSRKTPFLNNSTPGSQKSHKAVTGKKCTETTTERPVAETSANIGVTLSKVIPETQPPISTKKPVFDLQASLSRPLNYQPHRGKLKPWGKSKENHQSTCSHRTNYKQPLLQSREERREKHVQERKQRKNQVLETRRGLAVI